MPLILGLTAAGALGYYFYTAGEVPLAKRMCAPWKLLHKKYD
jgi:hypothetical protein